MAASNAQIGVAQAMRFPSIAITGAGGLLSEEFKKLFDSKAWDVVRSRFPHRSDFQFRSQQEAGTGGP